MNRSLHHLQLAIILICFSFSAIYYVISIPAGEGVDEIAHFKYILYIKEQHKLPIQPTQSNEPISVWMGHHPPLYYLINALLLTGQNTANAGQVFHHNPHFTWVENDGSNGWNVMIHAGQDDFPGQDITRAFFTVRLLGVIYGLVTLFALYRATYHAFPTITWFPFLATAIIAFNPSFIFMSSTIHHDILQAMWFALGAWWMVHYIQKRSAYSALIAGILVGLAVLTKISGVVLGLSVALVIIIRAMQEKKWSIFWRDGIISGGIATLIAGGWFIRNYFLYGDFLGWNAYSYVFHFNLRSEPSLRLGIQDFFMQSSRNFWGGFGFMHITFPEIAYNLWVITGIIMIGWVIMLLRDRSFFKQHSVVLGIAGFLFAGILGVYLNFSTINLGAGHGRYLFPSAFSIGIFFSVGVLGLAGSRLSKWVAYFMGAGLFIYALWLPIVHVIPKYAPLIVIDTLPSTAQVINEQLSPGVNIIGYDISENQPLVPGSGVEVVLYWQAATNINVTDDPILLLELSTPEGKVLSSYQSWPTPSLPPIYWPQNEIMVTRYNLYVPNEELSGTVQLTAEAKGDVQSGAILITELNTIGGASKIDFTELPSDLNVLFGNELFLRGFKLSETPYQPNETVTMTLFWEVDEYPTVDHTLFVHIFDSSGQLVAQLDRPAGGFSSPTSTWQKGDAWQDSYPVSLPNDLPSGAYTLRVGMYDWPSLEHLSISGTDESFIELEEIQITSGKH